ncbi:MAG: hypothetical protein AMK72_04635 [Planctomycetes bacterium SM23_25]|nr:MAG: hypothetical protein AMK72_04635 [Planctomycetes bacterium SM23_25]
MVSAQGIRSGRAFVRPSPDDSKLVRGLPRASARLKAFGELPRSMGRRLMGLDSAVGAPLAAAWAAGHACFIRAGIANQVAKPNR